MSKRQIFQNGKKMTGLLDKKRTVRFFILVLCCGLLVALGYYKCFTLMRSIRMSETETKVFRSANTIDYLLKESVDSVQMATYTLDTMMSSGATDEEMLDYLTTQSDVFVKAVDEQYDGLYGIFDGTYLDGIGWVPPEGYVVEERPWYQGAMAANGDVALITPYVDAESERIVITVSCMLPDHKSVVALDVYLDQLQKQIEKDALRNNWDLCMIMDEEGNVVAHSDPGKRGSLFKSGDEEIFRTVNEKLKQTSSPASFTFEGRKYRLFSSVVEKNWHVATVISEREMTGQVQYFFLMTIVTILCVALLLFLLVYREAREQRHARDVRNQLQAIANIYTSVYLIDLRDDSYMRIAGTSEKLRGVLGERNQDAQNTMRAVMDLFTDTRYKSTMFEFTNFSTLPERMENKDSIVREFIDIANIRCRARFIAVDTDENNRVTRVIYLIETDEELGGVQLV